MNLSLNYTLNTPYPTLFWVIISHHDLMGPSLSLICYVLRKRIGAGSWEETVLHLPAIMNEELVERCLSSQRIIPLSKNERTGIFKF